MRHFVVVTTFILLVVAFMLSVGWFYSTPDYEPALTCVVLLATITGLFIDRWLSSKERRHELLFALIHELYMNLNALSGPLFQPDKEPRITPNIYTRLHIATLDTAIASGAFTETRDRRLFHLMHAWRQQAAEFNRRLDITELRTYINPIPEEILGFRKALTGGVVLDGTKKALTELTTHVLSNYSKESGVDKDTVLFETFKGAT